MGQYCVKCGRGGLFMDDFCPDCEDEIMYEPSDDELDIWLDETCEDEE